MNYRNEPTLAEVREEVERVAPLLPHVIPIEWRIRNINVVRRIADKHTEATYSTVEFFENADGGKSIDIVVSTLGLDRYGDWKTSLLSRCLHEIFHAKIFNADIMLIKDLVINGYLHDEDEYNKYYDDLIEAAAEALEGVVHFFAQRCEI